MKKTSSFSCVASFTIPRLLVAVMAVQACAAAEKPGTGNSGGSGAGSGGRTGTSTGGSSQVGSGGSFSSGSGGFSTTGSGGSFSTGSGGAFTTGSGGSFTSGSGGAVVVGGSGGAPVSGGALTVVDGYAMGGTWKGYAYTFTGPLTGSKATVAPMSFMGMTSLCASGMIAGDPLYASVAGMGWNIAQEVATTATPPAIGTAMATGTGLSVTVTATGLTLIAGTSQLRAQIKGAAGDFCAPLAASGVNMIPWATFNATCWDNAGAKFVAGSPIKAVELVIPSALTAVGPFNVCLMDAKPY